MAFDRRKLMLAGLGLGGLGAAPATRSAAAAGRRGMAAVDALQGEPGRSVNGADIGLVPDLATDQTAALQSAIDTASDRHIPLSLAPGRYRAAGLTLRPGTIITGSSGTATLALSRPGPLLVAEGAPGLALHDLGLDGGGLDIATPANALVAFTGCERISLQRLTIEASGGNAIALDRSGGRVAACAITTVKAAAIFALDSIRLDIRDNHIADCGDNGILVWRRNAGEDGTIVVANRIERIAARSRGTGQYGNGINVFRAGSVRVESNRITECVYSAVRGNTASNIQIIANACQRIGEVALYSEFGFEGALIASNIVDGAAAGISVTNFDVGGRLAVVQGNLIRNLARRDWEPVDKRGEGITIEADASVTGNTIENAPAAGIVVGWGPHMRDCSVSANVIRNAGVGILVSADSSAGACLVTANMIAGARHGAIRAHDKGRPLGPDLVREPIATSGRVVVTGNVAS